MSTPHKVIQSDRLRDQIYQLLREDLHSGHFPAGCRLVEVELAERYGVSRTPVREALFQLAREGLLVRSERGYSLKLDTPEDFLQRMGVRLLLDPPLAEHAARNGTDPQIESLASAHARMRKAADGSRFTDFVTATHHFRTLLIEMSHNEALSRVCAVLEDQFLLVRNEYYKDPSNRQISVHRDGLLVEAIRARNEKAAGKVAREYIELLIATHSTPGSTFPGRKSKPTEKV